MAQIAKFRAMWPRHRAHHLLALLPIIALVGAPFFANRVEPRILGLPFLLAWTVGAVLLAAVVMAIIHRLDESDRIRERAEDAGRTRRTVDS